MVIHKTERVTMKDVATIADVSTQTVSRVVNDHPDVAPETRSRVQKVIAQVGYRPNFLARSLISQRSYTLGVVIAGLKLVGPLTLLSGISTAAEEAGYSLLLMELPSFDTDNIEPIFDGLLSRQVDGIIWAVPEVQDNRRWLHEISQNRNIPLVFMTMEPVEGVTVVSVNNYLGGRLAAAHLLEQGYKQIAHIAGPLDWWESRQRMQGWRDVLTEAGFEEPDQHMVMGDWSPTSGAENVKRLLSDHPEIDSIFVANDQMSLGVFQVLHQAGIRVPGDIGVVGFDNIQDSAHYWPSLTTVQQDQLTVGNIAVKELIANIDQQNQGLEPISPNAILVDPILVVRDSSVRQSSK